MKFKSSILPKNGGKWTKSNAAVGNGTYTLYKDGWIKTKLVDDSDIVIPSQYSLEIIFESTSKLDVNNSNLMCNMTIGVESYNELNEQLVDVISVPIGSIEIADNKYRWEVNITPPETIASYIEFELIAYDIKSSIHITSLYLKPSYSLSNGMRDEVTTLLPQLVHYQNEFDEVVNPNIDTTVGRTTINVGSLSNLTTHTLICGVSSEEDVIKVHYRVNNQDAPYSPVLYPIPKGQFAICIPACILDVPPGGSMYTVALKTTVSTLTIPSNSIQLTVEGKGIQGGLGDGAPFVEVNDVFTIPSIKGNLLNANGSVYKSELISDVEGSAGVYFTTPGISLSAFNWSCEASFSSEVYIDIVEFNNSNLNQFEFNPNVVNFDGSLRTITSVQSVGNYIVNSTGCSYWKLDINVDGVDTMSEVNIVE